MGNLGRVFIRGVAKSHSLQVDPRLSCTRSMRFAALWRNDESCQSLAGKGDREGMCVLNCCDPSLISDFPLGIDSHPPTPTQDIPLVLLFFLGLRRREGAQIWGGPPRPTFSFSITNHLCTFRTGKSLHLLEPCFHICEMRMFVALLSLSLHEARITKLCI